ncbi:hypothetical protein H2198_003649 [Neophaeococcomyces mojaviensis]|uniref:Uncharacterized protein n=1 Tax=Neophaeococcomyces mojaviensis TaxID=3383035 RepID=A0ACC3AAU0_9EURO|nr:hypothetical protein H2198_003649 [Knufia sp. JES_112]
MLALRSISRRPPRYKFSGLRLAARSQHDRYGPHKEYFQHPSQFPINGIPTTTQPAQPVISQHSTNVPPLKTPEPSRIRRAIQASFLTTVFLILGYSVGAAVVTWEYLQPPYEAGSEEYQELLEDIEDLIETCPLVEELREQGWIEESVRPVSGQSQHLVHNALSGTQGITVMKNFRPPTGLYSMFVFFAGFGVEGWPDVVHGGTLATMFDEALEQNFKQFDSLKREVQGETGIQFIQRVRPGEVYGLLVIPKMFRPDTDGTSHFINMTTNSFLVSGDNVPDFEVSSAPEVGGVQTRLDYRGGVLHAASSTTSHLRLSNIVKHEEETDSAFMKRERQEIEQFSEDLFERISSNYANATHTPPDTSGSDDK